MIIAVNFQLKQLERRSLKKEKIRASTGFEPVSLILKVLKFDINFFKLHFAFYSCFVTIVFCQNSFVLQIIIK